MSLTARMTRTTSLAITGVLVRAIGSRFHYCWRSTAREEFEVKDRLQATATGRRKTPVASNGLLAVVLEFEFLSRIIASKQSMKWRR
jgi:hypothetical protein